MLGPAEDFEDVFFIGIAGSGMSALAQYLAGSGKKVSGSDRYFSADSPNDTRDKLEQAGIKCYPQDGSGITPQTRLVVVSTAIEDTVPEVIQARSMNIPLMKRSELLALIADHKRTIAIGGTSGKSTTSGMLYQIMLTAGLEPGIISGAGLISLIREGKIGNAATGAGEWLIIEADESDGSIVQYHPEVGVLLNIDKDHQEMAELHSIFTTFRNNTKKLFITNAGQAAARALSVNNHQDFSAQDRIAAGFVASGFRQDGFRIYFTINEVSFFLNMPGRHNMENALAAVAVANQLGVSLEDCSKGLAAYEGIYRRHQLLGEKNGVYVIDDYAHNPAKCAASIAACQYLAPKVVAWFQPHGYGPTRFLKNDFIREISAALRPEDEIWMSEIFYAGGSAVKDISANDLITGIQGLGRKAYFIESREDLLQQLRPYLEPGTVLLLMGARDPSLETFAKNLYDQL